MSKFNSPHSLSLSLSLSSSSSSPHVHRKQRQQATNRGKFAWSQMKVNLFIDRRPVNLSFSFLILLKTPFTLSDTHCHIFEREDEPLF